MRHLFAISAGLWLATATLAADQAPVLSGDCSQPVPATCAPGADLFPYTSVECGDRSSPGGRFWASAEFLYWHVSGSNAPPLITTGAPATAVVAGGRELNEDSLPGLRFGAGLWLDECQKWGIEGSYLFLFDDSESTPVSSPGTPPLARPFFNATLGRPDAEIIASPGVASGSASVLSSFSLQGADLNVRRNLCCTDNGPCDCSDDTGSMRFDALLGFRYLRLHEDLVVVEDLTTGATPAGLATGLAPGTRFVLRDSFRTENRFYGGQFGLASQVRRGRLWLDVVGKLGIGSTHEVVSIDGRTTVTALGQGPTTRPGGLLALTSNSGRFVSDEFTLVPELGIRLGYQVGGGLRVFVGYDLLYWSEVPRPGEQVDLAINTTQIPPGNLVGVSRPAPTGRDTDLFLHGLSAGLEFRW
jgi:hypothetical protein